MILTHSKRPAAQAPPKANISQKSTAATTSSNPKPSASKSAKPSNDAATRTATK